MKWTDWKKKNRKQQNIYFQSARVGQLGVETEPEQEDMPVQCLPRPDHIVDDYLSEMTQ